MSFKISLSTGCFPFANILSPAAAGVCPFTTPLFGSFVFFFIVVLVLLPLLPVISPSLPPSPTPGGTFSLPFALTPAATLATPAPAPATFIIGFLGDIFIGDLFKGDLFEKVGREKPGSGLWETMKGAGSKVLEAAEKLPRAVGDAVGDAAQKNLERQIDEHHKKTIEVLRNING